MARNSFAEKYNNGIYSKTKKYQKKYGFQIGTGDHDTWNNEADAFKHTFLGADLAIKYTNPISSLLGQYHELQPNNPKGEKNMDLWNNQQGRRISDEIKKEYGKSLSTMSQQQIDDIIAEKIMQRMRNGELITHPSDKRKYTGFATKIESFPSTDDNVQLNISTPSIENPNQIPQNDMINYIFDQEMKNYRQNKLQTSQESFAPVQQDDNLSELEDETLNPYKKRKRPRIPKLQTLTSDKLDWYMKKYI